MGKTAKSNDLWVGISGIASYEVVVATSLKVLSDEIGSSYSTMKSKDVPFRILIGRGGMDEKSWFVMRVPLMKIKGRGNL